MGSAGTDRVLRDVLVVDLSDFEKRKQDIAQQLHHAATKVGFFYVKVRLELRGSPAQRGPCKVLSLHPVNEA